MTVEPGLDRQEIPRSEPELIDDFPVQGRSGARRIRRAAVWLLALGLVAAAVAFVIVRRRNAVPQMHYETAVTDRGTIAAKVTATGSLSALLTVQVGSQVSGRVSQINVDYNSPVKKGEVIARLDPLLFEAAVAQVKANLLSSQSNLKKDQAQLANTKLIYDRTKALLAAQVIAQSDMDSAQANYDAAKAQVDADQSNLASIQAALNQAQLNLTYATIVSPIDGTVISRNVDVGQTVAASFQAPTLFVIAQDLRKMQVDTNVGEADVGQLVQGMPATFTVDAYPSQPFTGRVRQIRNAAQTLQNVVTYDAVIDVANPNLILRPGMTANCTFVAAQKNNVIRLRNSALRFQPDPQLMRRIGITDLNAAPAPVKDANVKFVWALRNNKPVRETVVTGVTDGTWTELVSGNIQAGETLITDMTPAPSRGLF